MFWFCSSILGRLSMLCIPGLGLSLESWEGKR